MTPHIRTTLVAATVALTAGLAAAPQDPRPADRPDVLPGIWILAGGPMGGGVTSSTALHDGEWQEAIVWSGAAGNGDICSAGSASPRPGRAALPSDAGRPAVSWRVAFRRQAFDGFTATIEVRWRREVEAGANLEPAGDFDGAFTWRASEGESRVLDLVRQVPALQPGCDTQAITLDYRAIGPAELSEASIAYDVWLVQRLPSGEAHTRRFQTGARQDDAVRFAFPAVGIEAPALPDAREPKVLDVGVSGWIRGRARRDGRLDIAVDAGRLVGRRGRGLTSGSSGRTHLTVSSDETVELEPPPLYGNGADDPYEAALKDARTSIRVRARRLW